MSDVRYAHSGDIDLAYEVVGNGPVDLVYVSGFVSHLDLNAEIPLFRGLRRDLSAFARTIFFDKRGTGLSDRSLGFGSLAERMDDIRAVMDAAGVDRACLYGVSEGGPLAVLFAATYPDRVSKLALYGTFACGKHEVDYPLGATDEGVEVITEMVGGSWGTGHVMRYFLQETPDEAVPILARFERNACTPHMAEQIMRSNFAIDIRSVLPTINVPTLITHNLLDPVVDVEHGRYFAEHIPAARFVELPGSYHGRWPETDLPEELRHFLQGDAAPPAPDIDRVLSTVLFTDIVGSTARTASIGDQRWRELLDRHDSASVAEVERFGGRVIKTTGDGFLATFESPARGIQCATAIRSSVKILGLDVRAGIHTGEVERRGDDIAGMGVVVARRICDTAGGGEVLASRTVKDLVLGSSITFSDRGTHALKGVPDDWQLFAVGA